MEYILMVLILIALGLYNSIEKDKYTELLNRTNNYERAKNKLNKGE